MTQQTRIQYEVWANLRVTYSLHQITGILWQWVWKVNNITISTWVELKQNALFSPLWNPVPQHIPCWPLLINKAGGGGDKRYLVPKQKHFSLSKPCCSLPKSILILGHPFCPFFYYKVGFYCKNSPKFKSNLRFRLCTRIMILLLFPKLVWPA